MTWSRAWCLFVHRWWIRSHEVHGGYACDRCGQLFNRP